MAVDDKAYRRISYRFCYCACLVVMRGCSVAWFCLPLRKSLSHISVYGVCLFDCLLRNLKSPICIPDWLTGSRVSSFRYFLFFSENGCKQEPVLFLKLLTRVRFFTKIWIRIFNPKTDISFLYQNPKTDHWSKWSTTEVDSLDHTQNRILWIHDPKRFFTTENTKYSEKSEYCPRWIEKNFNTYISFLTKLFIFTAIFESGSWIKRSILCVLSGW